MEGASALISRQPPPNRLVLPKKLSLLSNSTNGRTSLPFPPRAEPLDTGNAEISSSGEISEEKSPSAAGFGGASSQTKKKGKPKRGPVIRRQPLQNPSANYSRSEGTSKSSTSTDQTVNESAFLLTWLGLGLLILLEGLALASSGFLPESVDQLFSKYVYPVFTPTVFLFVGGTVAYGVFKYLQGESQKS